MADNDQPKPATSEKPVIAAKPAAPLTAASIEAWFVEHFHGSVVATNTVMLNHVRQAVDALKARLPTIG